jgi:crotonobetainyl-CoA:carnitine CoA-transferase CaiB-like acyl-CoA transferase
VTDDRPLRGASGIRVLEFSHGLAAAYAGLILASQGARVCRVPIEGRNVDQLQAAYYDRGKVSTSPGSAATLIASADVILSDLHPADARARSLPTSIEQVPATQTVVHITPFGITGPRADYVMEDITEWAAGGLAYATRRLDRAGEPEASESSPLLAHGRQPELLGGMAGALGTFFALLTREHDPGPRMIDASRQEVQAAMAQAILVPFIWNSIVPGSPQARTTQGMLLEAADGHIYIRAVELHHWRGLFELIGDNGWSADVASWSLEMINANKEAIAPLIALWAAQTPRDYIYHEGQKRGLPVAMPRTLDDVLAWTHLYERGFWTHVAVHDGSTVRAPALPVLDAGELPPERGAASHPGRAWPE